MLENCWCSESVEKSHYSVSALHGDVLGCSNTFTLIFHRSYPSAPLDKILPRVWQIFFEYYPINDFLPSTQSWVTKNQDHTSTLVSNDGGNAFAREYYAVRLDIPLPLLDPQSPFLRSDLLRSMVLETEAEVYSDLDTDVLRPVRD